MNKCNGKLCVDRDEDMCQDRNPEGYTCTLPIGHSGNHIACSNTEHDLATWSNEEEER